MEFFMKFDTVKSGCPITYNEGWQVIIFKKYLQPQAPISAMSCSREDDKQLNYFQFLHIAGKKYFNVGQ